MKKNQNILKIKLENIKKNARVFFVLLRVVANSKDSPMFFFSSFCGDKFSHNFFLLFQFLFCFDFDIVTKKLGIFSIIFPAELWGLETQPVLHVVPKVDSDEVTRIIHMNEVREKDY